MKLCVILPTPVCEVKKYSHHADTQTRTYTHTHKHTNTICSNLQNHFQQNTINTNELSLSLCTWMLLCIKKTGKEYESVKMQMITTTIMLHNISFLLNLNLKFVGGFSYKTQINTMPAYICFGHTSVCLLSNSTALTMAGL